jgi:hypothetical protein
MRVFLAAALQSYRSRHVCGVMNAVQGCVVAFGLSGWPVV